MVDFLEEFEKFCETPNRKSGKPKSYVRAIKYLCEFLNIAKIDNEAIDKLYKIQTLVKNPSSEFYINLFDFLSQRGQPSYLKSGFIQAALPLLYRFYAYYYNGLSLNKPNEDFIISQELRDIHIKVEYNKNKLKKDLPILNELRKHIYEISRKNGTANENVNKIKSGRKAEKYFIEFLNSLGFKYGKDFKDVANDKNYGFDLLFYDIGLEIKNIKNGSFYLTDNEIAYLDKFSTHIILVDIDNGIWLLKNSSVWLRKSIKNIKEIRNYCECHYGNLDLIDIQINLDDNIKADIFDLTFLSKEKLINILS